MCCCGKPTINGQPGYSWDGKTFSTREPMPPTLREGEAVLFDEGEGGCDMPDPMTIYISPEDCAAARDRAIAERDRQLEFSILALTTEAKQYYWRGAVWYANLAREWQARIPQAHARRARQGRGA